MQNEPRRWLSAKEAADYIQLFNYNVNLIVGALKGGGK